MKSSALFTLVGVLLLAGCAGLPKTKDLSGVDVGVALVSQREALGTFGTRMDANPYLAPGGGIMGHAAEYVVVRFDIAAARDATFHVNEISAKAPNGASVAQLFAEDDFASYVARWTDDESLAKKLSVNVQRTYLPGYDFSISPGRRTYYVVLAGAKPLPRPFAVMVNVAIDSDAARVFTFQANP